MTTTTIAKPGQSERAARDAEARALMAERKARTPGPGWQVMGAARGVATFPAPPDPDKLGVLNADQRRALEAYATRLEQLAATRQPIRDAAAAVERSAADDAAAALAAVTEDKPVPPSVRPAREDALDRARRRAGALTTLASDDLLTLWRAVVPDRDRILRDAWGRLADDDGKRLARTGELVQVATWALHLREGLALPAVPAAFQPQPDPTVDEREQHIDSLAEAVKAASAEAS